MEKEQGDSGSGSGAGVVVLHAEEFEAMRKAMEAHDERREVVIKRSREILKQAKAAIFALHRGDTARAQKLLGGAEAVARELLPTVEAEDLRRGAYSSGLEEWVEGRAFARFLDDGTLVSRAELEIANADEYLGGVCDLTGEIGRFAVQRATKRDEAAVRNCLSLVDAIQGELLQFDFRNGSLRKKYDSVKYTVRKLETILYEMSLMRRSEAADVKEESGGEGPGSGAAAGDEA